MKGVYLVTDRALCMGRDVLDVVASAARGGLCAVQLREKQVASRDFVTLGRAMVELLTPLGIPLIINDRADIAQIIGAQGLHIGQSDIHYRDARALLGPGAIIGLSIETSAQAIECRDWGLDYIGASPIFGTPTKTDTAEPLGLDRLRQLRSLTTTPIVAIGGLNSSNCRQVIDAGADSVAVVSAICSAPDPEAATKELNTLFSPLYFL